MLTTKFIFLFTILFGILFISIPTHESSAEYFPPRKQWKMFADPDMLTCKDGLVLLQKNNGYPACVTPTTYVKLIDRDFAKYDFRLISNRPDMTSYLIVHLESNPNIMNHWHDMMIKNPTVIETTMSDWILQIKEEPRLLYNILGPIASEPELREKMIVIMRTHSQMEDSLRNNPAWMISVHKSVTQEIPHENCSWCPTYTYDNSKSITLQSDRLMDLIHHFWINDEMSTRMYKLMLNDPTHMAMMSDKMMDEILYPIMNDPQLREEMANLLIKHQAFMDAIRHN